MALESKVLDIIACPCCKGKLIYDRTLNELVCRFDRLAFPIEDSIPVLIEDCARRLTNEELPTG